MYEEYSKQALPSKEYRELLGSAIFVFNSNNQFVIENILRIDDSKYNWYDLIGRTSGGLSMAVKEIITEHSDETIGDLFSDIIRKRNRIIHSFQITEGDEQILGTKDNNNKQFTITREYLLDFIKENESLSSLLYELRGH
ncbi:selenium binding protein [Elizabethkingia anophelis]|nr:selenium binding protein [Elizabethkingia anophelis]